MTFLVAVTFLMWAHIAVVSRTVHRTLKGEAPTRKTAIFFWLHAVSNMTCLAGAVMGMGILPSLENGIPSDAYNWSVVAFFVFGMTSALLFGWKLIVLSSGNNEAPAWDWRSGLSLWGVAAGLYIMFTAVDHWWFFRDPDMSGVANASLIVEAAKGGVDDVQCKDYVAVRMESDATVFRCPESFVWGPAPFYTRPFYPWPSYREGRSAKLKEGIEALRASPKDLEQKGK